MPGPKRVLNSNTWSYLDNYILGNGTYTAKFKFFPHEDSELSYDDGLIHQSDLDELDIIIARFEEYGKEISNISSYKELKFTIDEPVPFLEQEVEFTISDLPYEVKGWSESRDLRKMDKDSLKKQVVEHYEYLRELLNKGENEKYTYELQTTKYLEAATMLYLTQEEYRNMLRTNATNKVTKGKMYPLENCKMVIEADGKLVKLLRTDPEFLNWDVLLYDDEKYKNSIAVRLHIPKGSDSLEIITK